MNTRTGTLVGIIALLIWSTNSAATISLVRNLGPLTALSLVCLLAGGVLAVVEDVRNGRPGSFLRIGLSFGLLGGACFLLYQILYYTAFALGDPALTMQLNLVNYLWPSLTVLLCVLRRRTGFIIHPVWLPLGLLLGLMGIAVSCGGNASPQALLDALGRSPLAFIAMLMAAISWAVFSALAIPLHRPGMPSGTPLFFLAVGVAACVARYTVGEQSTLDPADVPLLAYAVLAPSAGGYLAWELAMRSGNVPLLGALSNALPLMSTFVIWLLLGSPGEGNLGIGAILVCLGALLVHVGAKPVRVP